MNKYKQHIVNLCRRHNIKLYTGREYKKYNDLTNWVGLFNDQAGRENIFSVLKDRAIAVPKINTPKTYFCALHEIGHILDDNHQINQENYAFDIGKVTRYIMGREVAASTIALKLNKYISVPLALSIAVRNQYHYLNQYRKQWKTKVKYKFEFPQMSSDKIKFDNPQTCGIFIL